MEPLEIFAQNLLFSLLRWESKWAVKQESEHKEAWVSWKDICYETQWKREISYKKKTVALWKSQLCKHSWHTIFCRIFGLLHFTYKLEKMLYRFWQCQELPSGKVISSPQEIHLPCSKSKSTPCPFCLYINTALVLQAVACVPPERRTEIQVPSGDGDAPWAF